MTEIVHTDQLSNFVSQELLDECMKTSASRIKAEGDKSYVTAARQLELLEQLSRFDLGRYLLVNKKFNGYWLHYIKTFPWFGRKANQNNRGEACGELEDFLLNRAPRLIAEQQRFKIFLNESQRNVMQDAKLASIPCGMMDELLYLDYANIDNIELTGIDMDAGNIADAKALAEQREVSKFVRLQQVNAWELDCLEEFDLISSSGLGIYVMDNERVTTLFGRFFMALKPGGRLVTSCLTLPPTITTECEWDITQVHRDDLQLQKILFNDVIEMKWEYFRSTEQTKSQLEFVGFQRFYITYDEAKIFPTIVAYKP